MWGSRGWGSGRLLEETLRPLLNLNTQFPDLIPSLRDTLFPLLTCDEYNGWDPGRHRIKLMGLEGLWPLGSLSCLTLERLVPLPYYRS